MNTIKLYITERARLFREYYSILFMEPLNTQNTNIIQRNRLFHWLVNCIRKFIFSTHGAYKLRARLFVSMGEERKRSAFLFCWLYDFGCGFVTSNWLLSWLLHEGWEKETLPFKFVMDEGRIMRIETFWGGDDLKDCFCLFFSFYSSFHLPQPKRLCWKSEKTSSAVHFLFGCPIMP